MRLYGSSKVGVDTEDLVKNLATVLSEAEADKINNAGLQVLKSVNEQRSSLSSNQKSVVVRSLRNVSLESRGKYSFFQEVFSRVLHLFRGEGFKTSQQLAHEVKDSLLENLELNSEEKSKLTEMAQTFTGLENSKEIDEEQDKALAIAKLPQKDLQLLGSRRPAMLLKYVERGEVDSIFYMKDLLSYIESSDDQISILRALNGHDAAEIRTVVLFLSRTWHKKAESLEVANEIRKVVNESSNIGIFEGMEIEIPDPVYVLFDKHSNLLTEKETADIFKFYSGKETSIDAELAHDGALQEVKIKLFAKQRECEAAQTKERDLLAEQIKALIDSIDRYMKPESV